MRCASQCRRIGLRGSDIHAAVDECGIDADDVQRKSLTQADRNIGLADRRGSHQTNRSRSHVGSLSATQEQTIEVGRRNGRPGWATVIALICALGRFHLAKQCIHLVDR